MFKYIVTGYSKKDVKAQSTKKEPLIIRRGRYVWSIIEV